MNEELRETLTKLAGQLEGLADEIETSAAEVNVAEEISDEKTAEEVKEAAAEISEDSFGKVSEMPGKGINPLLDFIIS